MSESETTTQDSTELESRTERSLTECMTIMPNHPSADGSDNLFVVVGENENGEYLVNLDSGSCECADAQYNLDDDESCKHVRRVRIAKGETPVPNSALANVEIDSNFGVHVDGSPVFATADGGIIGDTDNDTDLKSTDIWTSPRPEIDKHGVPTGSQIVRCTDCGIETITTLTEYASHRENCTFE
jgi:predicted nucleic acid-binding Zn finger protein